MILDKFSPSQRMLKDTDGAKRLPTSLRRYYVEFSGTCLFC